MPSACRPAGRGSTSCWMRRRSYRAICADRDQIARVIGNLVTNALRATPAGGTITIAAVHRDAEMAFSVADTGAGIPREYLPRIFDPFIQVPERPIGRRWPRADDLAPDCRSARRPVDGPVGPRPGIHVHLYRPDGRAAAEHWPRHPPNQEHAHEIADHR